VIVGGGTAKKEGQDDRLESFRLTSFLLRRKTHEIILNYTSAYRFLTLLPVRITQTDYIRAYLRLFFICKMKDGVRLRLKQQQKRV
jgi:hypothetical protein